MRIRRTTTTLLLGGALALGVAGPATASPSHVQHTSCRAFGTGFAAWVQAEAPGDAGQWMADNVNLPETGPGQSGTIHHEHVVGLGEGPLCDLKTD